MKVTILGCGASGGVPGIGGRDGRGDWGACDADEPRNRRLRASILVEEGSTRVLVDTTPDLRAQCLAYGIGKVDGVLITHDHADHTHGFDDLRRIFHLAKAPVDLWADPETMVSLRLRFSYGFAPENAAYRPFVHGRIIEPRPFAVGGLEVTPFRQVHGALHSLGFRFGPIAYSTDLMGLPEESYEALAGVKVWIVDALKQGPHPTHNNVESALAMVARVGPERAVLTHMTPELDYRALAASLPPGVEPAYDGMVLEA